MVLIVLGLPRSGTSLVAGICHHLGVDMGSQLLAPLTGVNDRGFYEDTTFLQLHDEILRSHTDPAIFYPQPPASVLSRYRQYVAQRESSHSLWGVKDPKLCFLLPKLLEALSESSRNTCRVIVTRRPFDESVDSMSPLYGQIGISRAAELLGRYLYTMERNIRLVPEDRRLEVPFHGVLKNPEHWTQALAKFIGLPPEVAASVKDFVEPSLARHCRF